MKKYLCFGKYYIKNQISSVFDFFGPTISFVIHILVLNQLFDFIFSGKVIEGFTKKDLVWYVIVGEVFMYSFHYAYRIICNSVRSGDIAYNLSKPYNFIFRILAEQLSTLTKTLMFTIVGIILGLILAGPIYLSLVSIPLIAIVILLALISHLLLNVIVGLLSLWVGNDVSSIWLIISKFMLLLIFTPLDFFPRIVQIIVGFLPTTQISYTPAQLLVHFSYTNFVKSLSLELVSLTFLSIICYIIYKKGVKKLNVTGI